MLDFKNFCLFILTGLFFQFSGALAEDFRVGVQNSEPKFIQGDTLGGLCGEIYSELQNRLKPKGVNLIISPQPFTMTRIISNLQNHKSDGFCGAGENEARKEIIHFSKIPLYTLSNVMVAHKDETLSPRNYHEIAETGETIATYYGTLSSGILKSQIGEKVFDGFTNLQQALELIANKRRFKFFYYHDMALYDFVKNSDLPLKVLPYKYTTKDQWMIYSKKIPDHLRALVDDEIKEMEKDGTLKSLRQKYLSFQIEN